MALDQQSNMELEPQSPYSTSSTETALLPTSPTRRSNQHKRKDEEDFEFPPERKTALEQPTDLNLEMSQVNKSHQLQTTPRLLSQPISSQDNALPPPIMLKVFKLIPSKKYTHTND
ncbi:hypothetical protein TNCV_1749851 [Trichonephila clavipes]|nr:hypothetical protein TNCV_1749851 [Trichonephila clavipes]